MLINCVAYQEGKKLADVDIDDISEYVQRPGCFVWVALRDASDAELDKMQIEFGLHDLAIEDAKHGHLRVGEVNIFAGPSFVLSVRNLGLQSLLGVRQRTEQEPELLRNGPGFVLYALLDAVVDRYFPIIDTLESELEDIETQIFTPGAARSNIQQLYALKQRVTTVKHAVNPLAESAGKLWSGRVPMVCERNREYLRDVYDHLIRINASLDTLRETIVTAIQVNLSMVLFDESATTEK